jgi:hypothetical protein
VDQREGVAGDTAVSALLAASIMRILNQSSADKCRARRRLAGSRRSWCSASRSRRSTRRALLLRVACTWASVPLVHALTGACTRRCAYRRSCCLCK